MNVLVCVTRKVGRLVLCAEINDYQYQDFMRKSLGGGLRPSHRPTMTRVILRLTGLPFVVRLETPRQHRHIFQTSEVFSFSPHNMTL